MNYELELIEEMRKAHSNDDFVREFKGNLSPKVCKQIINLFEKETYLTSPGETGAGLDTTIKDSLDLMIGYAALESKKEKRRKKWAKLDSILCDALSKGVREYYNEFKVFDEKYPHEWSSFHHPELRDTGYQIQKTTPKSGGYVPHHDSRSEFIGDRAQTRHLTFIWYLNDVDGGPTGFITGRDVQPEEGKLVLFPATWNMIHWGVPPNTGDKYIVTGWLFD